MTRHLRMVVWCCCAAALGGVWAAPARAAELAEDLSLSGDLRVRHEGKFPSGGFPGDEYSRAGARVRLALKAELDENWDLGLRLATGGGMTSTNQTFDALNEGAPLYVDRAFARFHAGELRKIELFAGRMPNPYVSSFVLWDTDYNPDGLAEKLVLRTDSGAFFVNAGQHVLGLGPDGGYGPGLLAIQPGVEFAAGGGKLTAAVAYYSFPNADEVPADYSSVPPGNAYALADLYVEWNGSVSSGLPLRVWLDLFTNTEADADRVGFAGGIGVGATREKGDVSFSLAYAVIDRDAMWINLGDSTVAGGLEDRDSAAFVLKVCTKLGKGATLSATWYSKDDRYSDAHEDKIEINLVLKF